MKIASGIVLIVALLALVAAPAACGGGILVHCCTPEDVGHDEDHHEHACPADPCNLDTVVAAARSAEEDAFDETHTPANLPAGPILAAPRAVAAGRDASPPPATTALATGSLPLRC